MDQAAEELRFERAASLRDQIQAIEKVVEKQKVVSTEEMDSDVRGDGPRRWGGLRADILHPLRKADWQGIFHPGGNRG